MDINPCRRWWMARGHTTSSCPATPLASQAVGWPAESPVWPWYKSWYNRLDLETLRVLTNFAPKIPQNIPVHCLKVHKSIELLELRHQSDENCSRLIFMDTESHVHCRWWSQRNQVCELSSISWMSAAMQILSLWLEINGGGLYLWAFSTPHTTLPLDRIGNCHLYWANGNHKVVIPSFGNNVRMKKLYEVDVKIFLTL